MLKKKKTFVSFVQELIAFRKTSDTLRSPDFLKETDIDWHGQLPFCPQWKKEDGYIGFATKRSDGSIELYEGFSTSDKKMTITLPTYENGEWALALYTEALPPHLESSTQKIHLQPFSSFILTSV